MDYWVDPEGEHAIWYLSSDSNYIWLIGSLNYLGTNIWELYSLSNTLEKKCPYNEGYIWNWNFDDYSYYGHATNDVYIKCANEDDFCTSEYPCVTDQGDCDIHDECQHGLFCGSNNCLDSLGFHSEFDCCYAPTIGDDHFCTNNNPCALDEGHCYSNNECQTNLLCINSCPAHLGFATDVNCCSIGCKFYQIILLSLVLSQ